MDIVPGSLVVLQGRRINMGNKGEESTQKVMQARMDALESQIGISNQKIHVLEMNRSAVDKYLREMEDLIEDLIKNLEKRGKD